MCEGLGWDGGEGGENGMAGFGKERRWGEMFRNWKGGSWRERGLVGSVFLKMSVRERKVSPAFCVEKKRKPQNILRPPPPSLIPFKTPSPFPPKRSNLLQIPLPLPLIDAQDPKIPLLDPLCSQKNTTPRLGFKIAGFAHATVVLAAGLVEFDADPGSVGELGHQTDMADDAVA